VTSVFSSPAAKSGAKPSGFVSSSVSQTPWCRWITSTRGTVPSAVRTRSGLKRVIQPSTAGLSRFSSTEIVFCPGAIRTGPYSYRRVCRPSCAAAGAASPARRRTAPRNARRTVMT
jgi:hypothetical protein